MSLPKTTRVALAAAVTALVLGAPTTASAQTDRSRDVVVMTRNLYLGADLIPLVGATSIPAFEQAAAARFQTVLGNDFATRARAIAREIRAAKPDLVALQEAAVWRRGPDGVKDGTATPATTVVYDSLAVLNSALRAVGQRYRVAVRRAWFDLEAPTALNYDVRLTQQDAILVREGSRVRVGGTLRGGFTNHFDPPTQVGVARQLRGWVGVDARVGGRSFRFVSTHLEAYSPQIAEQQMRQLLASPLASRTRPSILAGDLNSDPRTAAPSAYRTAIARGFVNPLPRRNTCCFAEDLHNPAPSLTRSIDQILARARVTRVRSSVVGNRSADRLGGLWPSDHAGVVATLRLR